MSDRVCYIQRADRGAALRGLRLIGAHTDDTWKAGTSADPSLIAESITQSARWIQERLSANNAKSSESRTLSVLCLDSDGAVCSWIKPEDADVSLLDAAITGDQNEHDQDSLEPQEHSGISERFPQLPLELSFELLDESETSTGSRRAVMASPDVPGRLLKDELDAIGIRVDCVTSIWHALASVWDPGAGNAAHSEQRIVSSDAPIAATIAIDAGDSNSARLIWTWSREGKFITGGSSRIQTIASEHPSEARQALIRSEDIARVCSDWLGWSSQLGVSPSRVIFVGNPAQTVQDPTEEGQAPNAHQGLTAGEIGVALSQAWPDATIDLIEHNDPIGETLLKIATGQRGQNLVSLSNLGNRPGRAHRSMYRWAGLALVAVAAAIMLLSYQLFTQAGQIKSRTLGIENDRLTAINDFDPELVRSLIPANDLDKRLAAMRRSQGPIRSASTKPILEELETLSYVFGIPGVEIQTIKLGTTAVTVTLRVDDIAQAEQINQSLAAIKGSHLRWRNMTPKNQGGKIAATFTARWVTGAGS